MLKDIRTIFKNNDRKVYRCSYFFLVVLISYQLVFTIERSPKDVRETIQASGVSFANLLPWLFTGSATQAETTDIDECEDKAELINSCYAPQVPVNTSLANLKFPWHYAGPSGDPYLEEITPPPKA